MMWANKTLNLCINIMTIPLIKKLKKLIWFKLQSLYANLFDRGVCKCIMLSRKLLFNLFILLLEFLKLAKSSIKIKS